MEESKGFEPLNAINVYQFSRLAPRPTGHSPKWRRVDESNAQVSPCQWVQATFAPWRYSPCLFFFFDKFLYFFHFIKNLLICKLLDLKLFSSISTYCTTVWAFPISSHSFVKLNFTSGTVKHGNSFIFVEIVYLVFLYNYGNLYFQLHFL